MPLENSGKYFLIRTRLNGMALDISDGDSNPGARIITWPEHSGENQLWYHDPITNSIRSKMHNFCMEAVDGTMVMNPYNPDEPNQRFFIKENAVCNAVNNQVLDIADGNTEEGARVCLWDHHGGENQEFDFEYKEVGEYFRIMSMMNNKCFDMEMGSRVVVRDREDGVDAQLWYEDMNSQIRNKTNDKLLDTSEEHVNLEDYDSSNAEVQGWAISGNQILNRYDQTMALGIKDASQDNGAVVHATTYIAEDHMHWNIIPV